MLRPYTDSPSARLRMSPTAPTAAAAAIAAATTAATIAATAPSTTAAATTAARRRRPAAVTTTGVTRPLDRGPIIAAGRLTPLGLARPRLLGWPVGMIGVVRPSPDIGPIGMVRLVVAPVPDIGSVGMVRVVVAPVPEIGPISLIGPIGPIGPLAHGETRLAHLNGTRARDEVERIAGPRSDAAHVHVGAKAIFEIQTGPDARAQAIHE